MPELPEVETIRRGLEREFLNLQLESVQVLDPRLLQNCSPAKLDELRGSRLKEVARRGKFIILLFGKYALVIHPRMSGRLLPCEGRHTRLILRFSDTPRKDTGTRRRTLVLDDSRRFATLHCVKSDALEELEPLRRLGIEPFMPSYTFESFSRILRTKQEIKRLLLEQRKLAGLGNIYANEVLFRVRIHPLHPANSLSQEEARRLFETIPQLLEEALAAQGTTISDYRTASGESGSFQFFLEVYGRAGQPCRHCGTPIEKITQGGRSSYFCPRCQV